MYNEKADEQTEIQGGRETQMVDISEDGAAKAERTHSDKDRKSIMSFRTRHLYEGKHLKGWVRAIEAMLYIIRVCRYIG